MSLHPQADHPGHLSYVVKLHRDAGPAVAALRGRVENLATGRRFEFEDGHGLLAALAQDLGSPGAAAPVVAATPPDAPTGTRGMGGTTACLLLALASAAMLVVHPLARATQWRAALTAGTEAAGADQRNDLRIAALRSCSPRISTTRCSTI